MSEIKSLSEINFEDLTKNKKYTPSPEFWEDEVLYFLMVDRFSDNNEKGCKDIDGSINNSGATLKYDPSKDNGNAIRNEKDAEKWRNAGACYTGGKLKGIESKIGYLNRMGISAIWISPVFKQVSFQQTYHGYGIQNFLEVNPEFGKKEDLVSLVNTAHKKGIYVILDIILNHSGNVFSYDPDRYWTKDDKGKWFMDTRWDKNIYKVKGFNDKNGNSNIPFGTGKDLSFSRPDGAIWPEEFQRPRIFTCKGRINNWDYDPEFLEGDFCDLKDINLGENVIQNFVPSDALNYLCEVYKYWIAYADIDGFRVDTVKHMGRGPTRYFTSVIHEFAQSIGKNNFYLIGEITGGRANAFDTVQITGLNAALGIDDVQDKLEYLVKGYRNPCDYFNLFTNSYEIGKESHTWFNDKVITMIDDHDQIRKGDNKARFCANENGDKLITCALAFNITTLGIPCVYYGTEQGFDGAGGNDRYIRESMFGGSFGAFRSRDRHFFNEDNPVYKELAEIIKIKKDKIGLKRGRQYLREISGDGINFSLPVMMGDVIRSIIPWSRIFNNKEILCAINNDLHQSLTVWVTINNDLHKKGDKLNCIYSTDKSQIGIKVDVDDKNGKSVLLTVPPCGFVIYE